MTEQEFVQRSVELQLGGALHNLTLDEEARALAESAASGAALSWDAPSQSLRPLNGWSKQSLDQVEQIVAQTSGVLTEIKYTGTLAELRVAGADFSFVVDMQDRRARNLRLADGRLFPTICFNRLTDRDDRILWPLPEYHDIDSDGFLRGVDPNEVPWAQKDKKIVWRGIPGGRASPTGNVHEETLRLPFLLKRFSAGEVDRDAALAIISTFPRHRFVETLIDDPRADVGFISRKGVKLHKRELLAHLERPRISRQIMQRSKYLPVVRGNDVGSSFYWTMNSGSLGLVMDTPFESFGSGHFRPWKHYVPFREDMSDFNQIYDWCEAHQPECEAMTKRAAEVCSLLARADLRLQIAQNLVSEISRALRA